MALLPPDAVRRLVEAAKLDAQVPPGESFGRTKELDKAIEIVRQLYPEHFSGENDEQLR